MQLLPQGAHLYHPLSQLQTAGPVHLGHLESWSNVGGSVPVSAGGSHGRHPEAWLPASCAGGALLCVAARADNARLGMHLVGCRLLTAKTRAQQGALCQQQRRAAGQDVLPAAVT